MPLEAAPAPVESEHASQYRWYHKLASLLLAILCFEIGLFLIIFPWVEAWRLNYFSYFAAANYREASFAETWRAIWLSPYFRGAISGLGVVNVYLSFVQVFRLRRYSPSPADSGPDEPEPPFGAGEVR
jgi:hypothetical protein